MAFVTKSTSPQTGGNLSSRNNPVLMKVLSVDTSGEGTMQVEVTSEDNPDGLQFQPGIYTVRMDTFAMPYAERVSRSQKASGSFYGGLISEKTKRREGKKIMCEGVNVSPDGQLAIRWMASAGNNTENRAGLIHTRVKNIDGRKTVVSTGATLLDTNAFNVFNDDNSDFSETFKETIKHAQSNFDQKTVSKNARNAAGDSINWSSLPSTSMIYAIWDKVNGQVIETTELFDKLIDPQPQDYPDHLPAEERTYSIPGQPSRKRPLPYNAEMFMRNAQGFYDYAKDRYDPSSIEVIAVRGTRFEATRLVSLQNFHMAGDINSNRPIVSCFDANLVEFRLDPNDDSKNARLSRVGFVPSISLRFAANTQDTYHRYTTYQHGYPNVGSHFLTHMRYQGQPLQLHPNLAEPIFPMPAYSQQHNADRQGVQNQAGYNQQQHSNSQQGNPGANNQQQQPVNPNGPAQTGTSPNSASANNTNPQHSQTAEAAKQPNQDPNTQSAPAANQQNNVANHEPQNHQSARNAGAADAIENNAEFDDPRMQAFLDASGENRGQVNQEARQETTSTDPDFPMADSFAQGSTEPPAWFDEFDEDVDLTSDNSSMIDTSNNPAQKAGSIRSNTSGFGTPNF